MNYDTAKQIAAEVAPNLYILPSFPGLPDLFAVSANEGGVAHSITLCSINPATLTAIEAQEAQPEQEEQTADDGHTVIVPYQPARPAVAAKSVAELQTEGERKILVEQLREAQRRFGVGAG